MFTIFYCYDQYSKEENVTFKERAGKETSPMQVKLLERDIPYTVGDIILLKPDKKPAVITETLFRPYGTYKHFWSSDGKRKINTKVLVEITELSYKVRYGVKQVQPKDNIINADEPTEIIHYQERTVNWYEIFGKEC